MAVQGFTINSGGVGEKGGVEGRSEKKGLGDLFKKNGKE